MIRRVLTTLALAVTVGAAVVACGGGSNSSLEPGASSAPLESQPASESSPAAPSMDTGASPAPLDSAAPSGY